MSAIERLSHLWDLFAKYDEAERALLEYEQREGVNVVLREHDHSDESRPE